MTRSDAFVFVGRATMFGGGLGIVVVRVVYWKPYNYERQSTSFKMIGPRFHARVQDQCGRG